MFVHAVVSYPAHKQNDNDRKILRRHRQSNNNVYSYYLHLQQFLITKCTTNSEKKLCYDKQIACHLHTQYVNVIY